MHTFRGVNDEFRFVHNGDFSGNVQIVDVKSGAVVEIPFRDLRDFVAEYVRRQRMTALENMGSEDLLGIEHALRGVAK